MSRKQNTMLNTADSQIIWIQCLDRMMANLVLIGCLLVLMSIGLNSWILRLSCLHYANFSYIRENSALQGSSMRTLKNKSPAECETECINEYFCKSINTEKGGDRACELNTETEADSTDNVTLTPKAGWTFKSTNYSDQWVGEICKEFKPCPLNHVCMDSCSCPGYACLRCRGAKIGKDCKTEIIGRPLGLEDNSIENYQISSSSYNHARERGYKARLNSNGRWCANNREKLSYIRVDFAKTKIITDIAIQGHHSYDARVTSYQLDYTEDLNVWKTYEEDGIVKIFDGATTRDVVVKRNLQFYIRAFALKLLPKTWYLLRCLRMEVYGIDDPHQAAKPTVSTGCASNERPLGMASKSIADAQISASTSYNNDLRPSYARLTLNTEWCTANNDPNPFLQVDLNKKMKVTAVAVQGRLGRRGWTKSYRVSFSDSKSTPFTPFAQIFPGNTDWNGIVKNRLDPPVVAQFIRIMPVGSHGRKWCLRTELYGCDSINSD